MLFQELSNYFVRALVKRSAMIRLEYSFLKMSIGKSRIVLVVFWGTDAQRTWVSILGFLFYTKALAEALLSL